MLPDWIIPLAAVGVAVLAIASNVATNIWGKGKDGTRAADGALEEYKRATDGKLTALQVSIGVFEERLRASARDDDRIVNAIKDLGVKLDRMSDDLREELTDHGQRIAKLERVVPPHRGYNPTPGEMPSVKPRKPGEPT